MNLNNLTKEELIKMITSICEESKIQEYLNQTFEKDKLRQVKKELEEIFFPTVGMPYISLPNVEKIIADFEKDSSPSAVVDIELFYIETIIEFTQSYGIMGNDFYEHMITSFEKVIENLDTDQYNAKIEYLMGCMMYMNTEVYQKMVEIKG